MSDFTGPKATIDLGAVKSNYRTMARLVGTNVITSAVVKSDAYGLGAVRISQALYAEGGRNFWTAYLIEALEIRKVLPLDANIYYLQGFQKSDIIVAKEHKVTPVINSIDDFKDVIGNDVEFVIHIDSGLSRLGMRPEEVDEILPNLENEKIAYVISHLACSDEKDHPFNQRQKESFDKSLKKIRSKIDVKAGISATGGALLGRNYSFDMVRAGAFLYGIDTGSEVKPKNVLTLEVPVLQKYKLPAGNSVGYGATYTTTKETTIAVVSIGYADGVKRSLSNRGVIGFYSGEKFYRAPIIGNISMDLLACDVSDIPASVTEVGVNAYVLCNDYSINDMAIDAGVIPYEVLTSINMRSKRFSIFYRDGIV